MNFIDCAFLTILVLYFRGFIGDLCAYCTNSPIFIYEWG